MFVNSFILHPPVAGIKVTAFRTYEKNTLRAFVNLELASGLCIANCVPHAKGDDRGISTPARQVQPSGLVIVEADRPLARDIVEHGNRSLAFKLHPDHGGNTAAMQSLNRIIETLPKG
jgi:hypothetical protein